MEFIEIYWTIPKHQASRSAGLEGTMLSIHPRIHEHDIRKTTIWRCISY